MTACHQSTQHFWSDGCLNPAQTGLIGSDTDFRQFVDVSEDHRRLRALALKDPSAPTTCKCGRRRTEILTTNQYGNLTGLDIALVKDSYKYHTRLDAVEYIEPGAMQHFGDNVLAIMRYLADKPTPEELQNIVPSRNMLFFTAFAGKVFVLAKDTHVTLFYLAVFLATTAFVMARSRRDRLAGYFVCLLSIPASIVGGLVSANVAAFIMAHVLDKPMSYFKREWYCLALYAPPTLVGE